MKLRKNPYLKRRKRQQQIVLLLVAVLAGYCLIHASWWLALALVVGVFILRELFFADARFYNPAQDYHYRLAGEQRPCDVADGRLRVGGVLQADSLMLVVPVRASLLGHWFDPQLVLGSGHSTFERGANGLRFIDLSGLGEELTDGMPFTTRFCRIDWSAASVVAGSAEDYRQQTLLVVAPHADDAEIAAYGLYSQSRDAWIVTLTAGETEVEQFADWCDDGQQASLFKGRVRALDSVAAARWGGVAPERCVNLGYPCLQLQPMAEDPDKPLASPWSGLADTRPYRSHNQFALASDADGAPSWNKLVMDLRELLQRAKPDVLLLPHPALDAHVDHVYACVAMLEAVLAENMAPRWLLYANHVDASQGFPFGPAGGRTGLPPYFGEPLVVQDFYGLGLDGDTQRDKALALDLMHDLRRPLKWKKWLRPRLQALLPGRSLPRFGEDEYFRKAVRSSEWFIVADTAQVTAYVQEQHP